jgi:hypothetical protein
MKNQFFIIFLSLFVILFGLSCSSNNSNSENETATKTEEITESKEDRAETKMQKQGAWEIAKVVDEFGDEVKGEGTVIGIFEGKMSNSATTNSDLKVKIQVGKDKESYITFFEYENRKGNLPDKKFFKIKIKKEDGETEFVEQFSMNNMLVDTKGVLIEKVLSQNSPLKINVDLKRASKYQNTVYNFEIDPKGLKEILEK